MSEIAERPNSRKRSTLIVTGAEFDVVAHEGNVVAANKTVLLWCNISYVLLVIIRNTAATAWLAYIFTHGVSAQLKPGVSYCSGIQR